jgi:hypothetical protein
MRKECIIKWLFCLFSLILTPCSQATPLQDPLPSWSNGLIKQKIISFVETISNEKNKDYVAPSDRIATIDNDGTLWIEQPIYTQGIFILNEFKKLVVKHPEWQQQKSMTSLLSGDIKNLSPQNLERLIALTTTGMSTDHYAEIVKEWLATAESPRFKRHYTELIYQPMLEVIHYLQKNHFNVYIVSGGGQDFMRVYAENSYHISPEHVIGTTEITHYRYQDGQPILIKKPKMLFVSNNEGKPEAINLFIGKKPLIAFGNSDGDKQMLEWTQSGKGKRLMLLVHHDDAKREYAYDTQTKVGTFSAALFTEAHKNNWQIISMKNDWKIIFPFEKQS